MNLKKKSYFCTPIMIIHDRHVTSGGAGGAYAPPIFWQIRRLRRAAAAHCITTCPPRFLDFATCLHNFFTNLQSSLSSSSKFLQLLEQFASIESRREMELNYSRVHISSEETINRTEKNDTSYESLWSF